MPSSNKNGDHIVDSTSVTEGEVSDVNMVLSTVMSPSGEVIEIKMNGVDEAMMYANDDENVEIDPVYEKKLLRKIDYWVLPIVCALMSCQLMDKTTNSYASIMGLRTDLNMTSQEYSWVGSSFYLGFLVFEYPANYLIQRFPLSKTLSSAVMIWGVILMCHAACSNSAGFLVCRVLLGMFEGFMNPSYIKMTSQWWKTSEQFMRTTIWFGFQGFGTLVGAGIAHGLATKRGMEGHTFASWRLLYIITGIITIVLGAISYVHIPDIPTKAWFLNDKDKKYVVSRIRGNQQGFGSHKWKTNQVKEAFTDVTVYLFFFYGMSYAIPNGGFTNFGSILLNQDFGFSSTQALLMNMPGGGIDIVIPPLVAWFNYKYMNNRRLISCAIVYIVVIIGMCLLNFTHHKGSRLTGYYSFYIATATMSGVCSVVSSNIAGSSKKNIANVMFFIGYCVGNIVGPQTFKGSEAPAYVSAKIAMLVSFCAGFIILLLLMFIYIRRNNIRDKRQKELGEKYVVPENIEFADLTDFENPEFRYSL
ncbi:CYFA0S22e02366g1_1 [Cyberlindnera fabianii]|uniref:Allantoate permease n=1 Tax=Cyberlindnera fabianii TaxID=36022 RepID=A0A061BAC0_CYBFA|nr:Allantoate permease [Cyberlindnera fabianii]CDR46304.1 CYFA0S22e02366g1_1 [Cyberlindnera fabianii]